MSDYVCSECREPVASDSVMACPHCGYRPSEGHGKWMKIDAVLGIVCFLSVILSPLGLYLVWRVGKHRKLSKSSPAVPA